MKFITLVLVLWGVAGAGPAAAQSLCLGTAHRAEADRQDLIRDALQLDRQASDKLVGVSADTAQDQLCQTLTDLKPGVEAQASRYDPLIQEYELAAIRCELAEQDNLAKTAREHRLWLESERARRQRDAEALRADQTRLGCERY